MTTDPACPHPPEGVLPCGCTTDVLDGLRRRAGLPDRPERRLWATIEAHVAPHLGPLEGVLHDPEEGRVWADVLVHAPGPERPSIDLVTAGMSARRMSVPSALRRRGVAPRTELVLRFPPDWAGTRTVTRTILGEEGLWTLSWLRVIVWFVHANRGFLADARGLPLPFRALPMPVSPGCPFEGLIAADPARFGRPIPVLRGRSSDLPIGKGDVRFLSLVPLLGRELEFAIDRGPDRLFSALATEGVDDLVRLDRSAVV